MREEQDCSICPECSGLPVRTAQVCILAFSFIHADNDPLEFLPACMNPFQRTLSRTFGATGQRLNAIYSRFVLHTFPEPAVTHVQTIYFRFTLLDFGLCSRPFTSLIFSCFFTSRIIHLDPPNLRLLRVWSVRLDITYAYYHRLNLV